MNPEDAYRARLIRNDAELRKLAADVKATEPTIEVYAYQDRGSGLLNGVTFIKGDEINSVGFHEVPYRWSGCGYSEHPGGERISMPFTVEDVLSTFHPINTIRFRYLNNNPNDHSCENFKGKGDYLKWYSYLKPLETL